MLVCSFDDLARLRDAGVSFFKQSEDTLEVAFAPRTPEVPAEAAVPPKVTTPKAESVAVHPADLVLDPPDIVIDAE